MTSIAESGFNGSTVVTRSFDGYGAIGGETVAIDGVTQSSLAQHFDAAGRRNSLDGAVTRTFVHNATGQMTSVSVGGNTYSTTYGTNGLLVARGNPFRSVAVQNRDSLGRVTDQRTTVAGALALKETVPVYFGTDQISGLFSERAGAGS